MVERSEILMNDDVTYSTTTVFQKYIDIVFVFEVIKELDDVFVVKGCVQFDFPVNLKDEKEFC